MSAALDEPDRALAAWRTLKNANVDWSNDPIACRWLPLIAINLGPHVTDAGAQQLLRASAHQTWRQNIALWTEAAPVFEEFRRHRIEFVLLKGAALLLTAFPFHGARPLGDVDLLVHSDQLALASGILEQLGWQAHRPPEALAQHARHGFDFRRQSGGAIDLHQFLLADCVSEGIDDGLWDRLGRASLDDSVVNVLSPADQLLHISVHGLRWSPVHAGTWVADAIYLLRAQESRVSWDVLVAEAHRRRLGYQMREALQLLQQWMGEAIPSPVIAALGRHVSLADRVECRLKSRPVNGPSGLIAYWFAWRRARALTNGHHKQGFLEYVAGLVGLRSRRQLPDWLWQHAKRRWAARLGDPWGKGLSQRPIIKPMPPSRNPQL